MNCVSTLFSTRGSTNLFFLLKRFLMIPTFLENKSLKSSTAAEKH